MLIHYNFKEYSDFRDALNCLIPNQSQWGGVMGYAMGCPLIFVIFQKHLKIDVFVPDLVKKSSKVNKKDHFFVFFLIFCSIFRIW